MNKLVLIPLSLFVCNSVWADGLDDLLNVLPKPARPIASTLLKVVPKQQRQGLNDYLTVTGVDTSATSNVGIRSYVKNYFEENSCVQDLAADFYSAINLIDATNGNLGGAKRVNISSNSKQDFNLSPGWLWNLALSYADGDKLLAMQLIGVCGHDDVNQLGGMSLKLSAKSPLAKNIRDPEVAQSVAAQVSPFVAAYVLKYPKTKNTSRSVGTINTNCPVKSSAMYYPGSLGAGTDISESLKDRIIQAQAPTQGARALPAKYYHVMGEAFASCFLVRREVPNFFSSRLIKGAINAYRSSRTCEKLAAEELFNISNKEDVNSLSARIWKTKLDYRKASEIDENAKFSMDPFLGQLISSEVITDADVTEEIVRNKVSRAVAEYDSAKMFKKSLSNKLANQCSGPQLSTAVRGYLILNSSLGISNPCPADLSQERCKNARNVMATYLVDFEWSEAQHLKGLEFAQKNCPKYVPEKDPAIVACRITRGTAGSKSSVDSAKGKSGVN